MTSLGGFLLSDFGVSLATGGAVFRFWVSISTTIFRKQFFCISLFSRHTHCYIGIVCIGIGIGIFRCRDSIPGALGHGSCLTDALVRAATVTPPGHGKLAQLEYSSTLQSRHPLIDTKNDVP